MSTSEVIGKIADAAAGAAASTAGAIKGFAEKLDEAEMRAYEENLKGRRGARNLHAAVRVPILAAQGQRIHAINSASEALRCKATRGLYNMLDKKLKDQRPSEPDDERGMQTLVHRTSPAAGRSILDSRHMRPGREGTLGAGIYFAEDAQACAKKAQIYGGSGAYALVTARVDLGRCRVVKLGELGWRMVRDCGFKQEELDGLGFQSVGTNFHGGWEYCVFDPARVEVVDVTFHNPREESLSPRPPGEEAAGEASPGPAEVAPTLIRASPDCEWESYTANPKVVLVIAPGAGMKKHAYLYEDLERQGYEVVPVFDDSYDHYPPGTEVLGSIGFTGIRMPDLRFNRTKNLATFVDEIVHPRIVELVSEGRGPAAVIAASRGGIVSTPRLWEYWQGPCVVGNGGFVTTAAIPVAVRCVLITGGWDCFVTRNPDTTAGALQKEDPASPVLLYHDPREDHDLNRLQGKVLGRLVQLATSEPFDADADGPWPDGAQLRIL